MEKIGDIGEGGAQLAEGNNPNASSLKNLIIAMRDELDALYAKLDGLTVTGLPSDFAATLPKFEK